MKRAGRIARKRMEKQIAEDDSWMDAVDIPDKATLNMGDLGSLVISRILNVHAETVQIPISKLGIIQRSSR
jgi:hypothetical protein